ncbi:hypothetical protein HPB49_023085 [Dermacentor silvarum]|uniref:Uncharacterized protein n=1 Tax=Dermacentor silvarum TaxID=543639 RepID=A0ACB8D0Q2_DERSI|nr:hypothetical protein HPB49_023085 [Dermacentor silvarum]
MLAQRQFGVSEKSVRYWRNQKSKLSVCNAGKTSFRGRQAVHPELEDKVVDFVRDAELIRTKAVELAREAGLSREEFKGSIYWSLPKPECEGCTNVANPNGTFGRKVNQSGRGYPDAGHGDAILARDLLQAQQEKDRILERLTLGGAAQPQPVPTFQVIQDLSQNISSFDVSDGDHKIPFGWSCRRLAVPDPQGGHSNGRRLSRMKSSKIAKMEEAKRQDGCNPGKESEAFIQGHLTCQLNP